MTSGKAWTEAEQAAAITAYNLMLAADNSGTKYNKAAFNRALRSEDTAKDLLSIGAAGWPHDFALGALAARSRGAVEAKMMNISAAREKLGLPILKGYKAAGNYQRSLETAIQEAEA